MKQNNFRKTELLENVRFSAVYYDNLSFEKKTVSMDDLQRPNI